MGFPLVYFNALTLLVGWLKGRLACKKPASAVPEDSSLGTW